MLPTSTTLVISDDPIRSVRAAYQVKGTYTGFSIHSTTGRMLASAFAARGFTDIASSLLLTVGSTGPTVTLPAGRYRVSFFTDAGGSISLPALRGSVPRLPSLKNSGMPRLQARWFDLGQLPLAIVTRPITLTPTTSWVMGHVGRQVGLVETYIGFCLRPEGASCVPAADDDSGFIGSGGGTEPSFSFASFARPAGTLPPGRYEAQTHTAGAQVTTERYAFFAFLD